MNDNSTRPITIGAVVAALVIGAFVLGQSRPWEEEGPAERLGQTLDGAAQEMKEGVEHLEREAGSDGD